MKRTIFLFFAAFAFLAGTIYFSIKLLSVHNIYQMGQEEYKHIKTIAYAQRERKKVSSEQNSVPFMREEWPKIDEKRLSELNADYRFWVCIPDTNIDYPVLQHQDDIYYLDHTFENRVNICGSLFTSAACWPLSGDNTIIYGHNMKNGSMFADLKAYTEKSYFEEHPEIWIYNGDWIQCPIFTCQLIGENESTPYIMQFLTSKEKGDYIDRMVKGALYDTGIVPEITDRIITLSTCYGKSQRCIVQAIINNQSGGDYGYVEN
ncbi:MAG: class B sortase [Enterocloster asparagiformis]|nr:class B sortase [Enterocloster asparagiformis]